jgi:hypothetical protein
MIHGVLRILKLLLLVQQAPILFNLLIGLETTTWTNEGKIPAVKRTISGVLQATVL